MNHAPHGRDEDRLRGLLRNAVDDVDPDPGIEQIRRRTQTEPSDRTKVTAMPTTPRHSWLYGAVGAAAAVAAVVGLAVVVTRGGDQPGPAASSPSADDSAAASATASDAGSPSDSASSSAAGGESTPATGSPDTGAVAVYYVGDAPTGPRLFREFHRVDAADAVTEVGRPPLDPDYRTDWRPGDVVSTSQDGDVIRVAMRSLDLGARPAGMTGQEATAAIQSLVYTTQAAYQSRALVQFTVDGDPMPSLYGVTLEGPVKAASIFDTLSLMSITAPEEGQQVSGSLAAEGVNNGPEATVVWQLKQGDRVVRKGSTTAAGWMDERLFPWKATVSLAGVPAGTYTFVAMNDDPSGGEEGNGPATDTRTVVVR